MLMKSNNYNIRVCLSLLQTGLGIFEAFFGFALLLGNSQTNFNDCVTDALAKTLIIWFSIIIGWFLGQRKKKRVENKNNSLPQNISVSKISKNMMISNVITSILCLLIWLLCRNKNIEVQSWKAQDLLLLSFVISVSISIIMAILHHNYRNGSSLTNG